MADSIMFQEDAYLVLEPDQPEQILSPDELAAKLAIILSNYQGQLEADVARLGTIASQAEYLRDTACEFMIAPGQYIKWYVVRLEKP